MDYESSPAAGRSVDIELGGQEVITIDLDNLDPNPEDVLDLLKEGQCKVWVWTKLAGEYWRRGYLGAAEKIAQQAIDCEFSFCVFCTLKCLINMNSFYCKSYDCIPASYLCTIGQYTNRAWAKGAEDNLA
jgi:hypothetical protein